MKIVFIEPLGISEKEVRKETAALEKEGHEVIFYPDRNEEEEVLVGRARDAEVVVVSNIPLKRHFLESCPKLKMISVGFTGVDHIDLDTCREKGITVCNAAGYSTQAVAELTIGMMIAVYRRLVAGNALTRICETRQMPGCELHGKAVGIIGLGAIGQRVAALTQAFGCRVMAYSRSRKNIPGVEEVSKEELLRRSDIITLHVPLKDDTRDLIDEAAFEMMQPHAILINTARGPVVNQTALYNALKKGRIAGAATDVYSQEPPLPADFDLFNAPNLLMLPHVGFATMEAFVLRLGIVVANVSRWLAGCPQNKVC